MRLLSVFLAFFTLLVALLIAFPDLAMSPGALLKGHEGLKRDCLRCHEPFGGVKSRRCIDCHHRDAIGLRKVSGELLPSGGKKLLFHKEISASSCLECHSDHHGPEASLAIRGFSHDRLPSKLQNDCATCHLERKPGDDLHRIAGNGCAGCHDTMNWKSAIFDHLRFEKEVSVNCATCHGNERPSDSLHQGDFANCGKCHATNHWKPATFDHRRWFRLEGEHRAECRVCHTDRSGFGTYTCYGCHEHSRSGIAAEHLEEGIGNFQNCVRCHRSGDEHEIEREHGQFRGGDDD
jgi:hypothetical protein